MYPRVHSFKIHEQNVTNRVHYVFLLKSKVEGLVTEFRKSARRAKGKGTLGTKSTHGYRIGYNTISKKYRVLEVYISLSSIYFFLKGS